MYACFYPTSNSVKHPRKQGNDPKQHGTYRAPILTQRVCTSSIISVLLGFCYDIHQVAWYGTTYNTCPPPWEVEIPNSLLKHLYGLLRKNAEPCSLDPRFILNKYTYIVATVPSQTAAVVPRSSIACTPCNKTDDPFLLHSPPLCMPCSAQRRHGRPYSTCCRGGLRGSVLHGPRLPESVVLRVPGTSAGRVRLNRGQPNTRSAEMNVSPFAAEKCALHY